MSTFTRFVKQEELDNSIKGDTGLPQLFLLYLKTVYSTTAGKVVIIFSPMLVALALSVMFPIYMSVGAAQVFVTSLSAGVIWGMTYFSIRRTTFYSNLNTTRINTIKVYVAIWFVMLFVTFWSEATYWVTTILLDVLHVNSLVGNIFNVGDIQYDMTWYLVDWFTLIYTWIGSVTLMFVACFATRWLFNNEQLFFIALLVYILALVPFGGILPPMPDKFSDEGGIVLTKNLNAVGYISMLIPQYHLNLFNYVAVWSGTNQIVDGEVVGTLGNMHLLSSFHWSSQWQWNFTILYPLVSGFALLIVDILTLDFNR